jgi:predicted metalloprotease with PDZ domain
MKPFFISLLIASIVACTPLSHAQETVLYEVSLANAVHHEARISVTYDDLPASLEVLEMRMSRSSPGRYALHEFAKNVYQVSAQDRAGNPLTISRPSPYQWNIANPGPYVKLSYTLFADRADGTYSQIDLNHAHLNMPATFMWARHFDHRPLRVQFKDFNADWGIATQLVPTPRANEFTAPDLQYFMDSPTEVSAFSLREFSVQSQGENYQMRLAVHHDASEEDVDELAQMAEKVVYEHIAVYEELPRFDHGTYTFIADYLPYVNGDGMEHRNSTILTSSNGLSDNASEMLGTLSHEFFHSWNVERIRPRSLQPFNYEEANLSGELWLAEGFTQYYGNLLLRRSGMRTEQEYLEVVQRLVNAITHSTGRAYFSPVEMSMQAPFVDAATALDPTNFRNTFFTYYTYGAALALSLDLTLRSDFDLSLDDYMRALWRDFGRTEIPYTLEDLQNTLAHTTADAAFAADFFRRYIYSSELPDYARLLANAGLLLQVDSPEQASLGTVELSFDDSSATLESPTLVGSPLYIAGLGRGDHILRIGRYNMRSKIGWERLLNRVAPGDTLPIEYEQRGVTRLSEVTFISDPALQIVSDESVERPLSVQAQAFREKWLGSQVRRMGEEPRRAKLID